MPTKIEPHLSTALQVAGRAFLSAVFVTSELLIHADLAARALWSYVSGGPAPERAAVRPAARHCAITDQRRARSMMTTSKTRMTPKTRPSRTHRSCSAAGSATC